MVCLPLPFFFRIRKRPDNKVTSTKQRTCLGTPVKAGMISMHQVFSVADPLKLMELIFSIECLLIKMVFSESHSVLSNKLLKLKINDLYVMGRESDLYSLPSQNYTAQKPCVDTFCISEMNSLTLHKSNEHTSS